MTNTNLSYIPIPNVPEDYHSLLEYLHLPDNPSSLGTLHIVTNMSLTNASPEAAAKAAKISSRTLAILSVDSRNAALQEIHDALAAAKDDILAANSRDLEIATKSAEDGELSQSILKRLDLSRKGKFEDMLQGILDVKNLGDPGQSFSYVC